MTTLDLVLILWAVTAPIAYLVVRHDCRSFGKWTQGDRLLWVFLCLLYGPVMLAVLGICGLAVKFANTPWAQREARW